MKNIMFLADGNEKWIGGIYYVKNVIYSLLQNKKTKDTFKIYIYVNEKFKDIFEVFLGHSNLELIQFEGKIQRIKLLKECLDRNITAVYPITSKAFNSLGDICINWIPDFQHIFLPEMFSQKEINVRDDQFSYFARESKNLVLSSNDAKNTYLRLYPQNKTNITVLPFVSYIEEYAEKLSDSYIKHVLEKYKIEDKFIYLPNQFWKHKNHIVVYKAINYLVNELKIDIQLICTGNKSDYRNLDYFSELEEYINNNNLCNKIKILGLVSREEQLAIMKASKLIIQPSLFEGWGTVLEEAKFFDKRVLLSNIPVHYEQQSKRSVIFDRKNHIDLAEKIVKYYSEDECDDNEFGKSIVKQNLEKYSEIEYNLFSSNVSCKVNLKLIDEYKKKLRYLFNNSYGKNVGIYGTGDHTSNLIDSYEMLLGSRKFNVYYLDSKIEKKGQKFRESEIYHKDDILNLNLDKIIISSYEFQNEIYEDIKKYEKTGIEIIKIYEKGEEILFI